MTVLTPKPLTVAQHTASTLSLMVLALALWLPAGASAADDGAQVTNAYRGVMQDRSANSPAEALFVEKCSMCHRQMGMGTVLLARRLGPEQAMLEQRQNLDPAFVAFAVRNGIGNMPRIGRGELSDADLTTLADWLASGDRQAKDGSPAPQP